MKNNRFTRRNILGLATALSSFALTSTQTFAEISSHSDIVLSPKPKKIGIVLFNGFETLDVFGPVQMWGKLKDYEIVTVCQNGGIARSSQGLDTVCRYSFVDAPQFEILMIPGGGGTRKEVNNTVMLDFLRHQNRATEWTTSVCTGAAVLARAGILDNHRATTNKNAWVWATSNSKSVKWQPHARWVFDGKYVTSSGVSAGTDMALALVKQLYGQEIAQQTARLAEYVWNGDPTNDPFAIDSK
ncbi:DJ-1/PfpI family protein [Massilia phyllosphaerae]|uniref:DJ-1/PfpI family protein n=1 Tax=Massilia phyllosphaerae TaxID=3106034 RepID=UPI002B1CDE1E|nr:DJ-1/PfpI family protein [Massilia sp. SGZ-792]